MPSEIESFDLQVEWVKMIFQTRDRSVVALVREGLDPVLEVPHYKSVVLVALCTLAETDPALFRWALHNYDPDLCLELGGKITEFAVQQLVMDGFVPGVHFSSLPEVGLVVAPALKTRLRQGTTPFFALMIEEFVYSVEQPSDRVQLCCHIE